ncbi:MAG: alpha/beta hydrolase [Thermoflexales bacterium]|nr:alpha/beta hydrolase [Thermoflexales bacterium]
MKPSTREQYAKRAKILRKLAGAYLKLQSIGFRSNSLQEERFIETDFGRVRTLWYGFQNPEMAPVYLDLHGGGFVLGSADMDERMNMELLRRVGCKIISIDYAKAPEHPYPVAVNQVYAVVEHVFTNAERYGIDRNRIAIGGHSAGGNLSTVMCIRAKKEGKFRFVCQILDYPPLDLATSPLEKPRPKGAIPPRMAMMFDACYVDPALARDIYVSPVYATREDLEGLPPALIIVAGRDSLRDEGLKYCEMLKAAGVVTECYEYPDAPHGFTYQRSRDAMDARDKMAAFLRKYLMVGENSFPTD